jgi:dTDP-D-glucose 4,6-dehydratase
MRKLMDVGRLDKMGWRASIDLEQGLINTYDWYLANMQSART